MIGVQRGGTTSLYRTLREHPQVMRARFRKGVNYFDLNYYRGLRWYQGQFPVTEIACRRTARDGGPVAFEASGYYLYHPFALERLARDLPETKLVAMLRDPVERAFSAYKHEYARGFERESLRAGAGTGGRAAGRRDRTDAGEHPLRKPVHGHQLLHHRGHYAEQLERAFSFFPREQVYVMDSGAYFEPARAGIPAAASSWLASASASIRQLNSRPSGPMPVKPGRCLRSTTPRATNGWPSCWAGRCAGPDERPACVSRLCGCRRRRHPAATGTLARDITVSQTC